MNNLAIKMSKFCMEHFIGISVITIIFALTWTIAGLELMLNNMLGIILLSILMIIGGIVTVVYLICGIFAFIAYKDAWKDI